MKALIVLSVICLVTTVTGQYHDNYTYVEPAPSSEYDEHYTSNQPGELVPHSGFTVQFLIEAAGRLWQQNSVFEAMTFACEGVLPVIGSMIDEVDQSSLYWGVFCDNVTRVKSVSEFNGQRWCNDIIDTVTGMFGNDGQDEGRYRRQAPDESSLESPFGILENLLNTTRDLYGIDILMIIQNVSTINTICTDVTENFLRPSPKQVITDFAAELIVRLLPEVCQTWHSFFEAVGLNSSSQTYRVILGLVDAGSDAVGYSNFDELCHDINQTVQDDDLDERRRIAELIIRNFIGILENGDQCSTLAKKIINAIWTLTNCGNSDPYSSPYGLEYQFYMFTGFHSVEEMCYDVAEALTTAVELPRARLATLIPGTNITFPFFVNAAGGAWQQDRLIDVLAYACSDILPAITTMVPEIRSFSFLFEPICRQLRSAAKDLEDFDSTGYCNELTDMVTALLPSAPVSNDSIGDPGEGGGADSMDDPLGILNALMNVTLELYNINIFDPSTICPNIEGLLRKPFPAILLEFGGEMMSRFLPLALQPLCRLDSFLEQFGVNSSSPFYDIIQEAVRLASRAVGYEQRDQLCAQIVGVVHKVISGRIGNEIYHCLTHCVLFISSPGHEKRLRFSKDIIKELFRIPFNADTCDSLLSGAIRRVVRPLLTEVIPGSGRLIRISDYLISRFSGYRNVYDFCNHLETAFKSEVPLPRPAFGEIISGSDLTISLLINLAGSLWSQESTMESLDYVCTHVLPVITRTVPEFREARVLLRPFCDVIESAGNQFDATDVCLDLVGETLELISFLTPQSRDDLYTCPTQENTTHHGDEHIDVPDVYQNKSYSIETVEDVSFVLALLVNISETFNIDIANLTTICPLAPRLLRPRLPDVIKDFGSEIFSFLLPLAEPICHNFTLFLDSTLASFGVNSSSPFYHIIQDAVRIASKLVEYPTIEELCGDIVQKLADFQDFDDNNRLDFTKGIINSLMELTTNVDRCTQISTDILVFIVEPLINIGNEGERFNITLDLIHTYTGFRGVEPICQAMQTAFDGCASPRQADIDACGECIRRPSVGNIDYHFVSNHADCTGRCPREQDGTNGPAELNSCLRCVGGSTWRPSDAGMNECGTCGFLAGFDCVGCDGQINSGLEFDACDLCGGDGSDCTAVSSIVPEIIPSGGEYEITAHGGGLNADPAHICRFSLRNGDTVREFTLAASQSYVGTCTVNNLPAALLVNISETFNIDIANLTTICPLAPRLLRPRLPDVIMDFGFEIFSFLLPLAEPICHNFTLFLDSTLASFGVNSSSPFYHIIQDAVRIASKLVEYPTIEELCGDIVQKLADFQDFDDNNRLDFTKGIINSLMELTTNVDRCTQISTDILVFIVEPLINIGNEGERFNITLDLIHTYTGFRGVEPICQAMQTAFDGCASPRQADIDACGECIRRPSVGNIDYHFVSNHADCTGRCPREQDGTNGPAELNSCLRCVGGSTWRPSDAGMNECGTCGFLAGFDCVGCDGQINSGLEFDACDICGGDGSDCTAVSSIVPEIIPSGGEYEITAHGGGLSADPAHVCRFSLRNGDTVHEFALAASQSYVGTCTVNNLPAGTYDFSLLVSGTDPMNTSITLQVYDPIDIDSVSPEEFTLVPNSDITLTFTAASNAFEAIEEQGLTPYLAYERGKNYLYVASYL
nr:uncharacterized protein LOC129282805 [Lytechinus pictus]